jgi:hypothetical protein
MAVVLKVTARLQTVHVLPLSMLQNFKGQGDWKNSDRVKQQEVEGIKEKRDKTKHPLDTSLQHTP